MPVWRSTDPKLDIQPSTGKQRRHINERCPNYQAVPTASRCRTDGVPNTERVRSTTVRCEHSDCWEKRVREDQGKKKASSGKGKVSQTKAASTPTTPVGGKAQSLADRAKAARQKPKAKAAPAKAAA